MSSMMRTNRLAIRVFKPGVNPMRLSLRLKKLTKRQVLAYSFLNLLPIESRYFLLIFIIC